MNEQHTIVPEDSLETSEISQQDWKKIKKDLGFVQLLRGLAQQSELRVIISGGYAVDGALGQITRPHNDIDVQVYGQPPSDEVIEALIKQVKGHVQFEDLELVDKGRETFYHSHVVKGKGFGADVYYVQILDGPFDEEKIVIKSDGSHTEVQRYNTIQANLEGVSFEAVDPTSELVDKLYKREIRGDEPKLVHDQDIANLRLITDESKVKKLLDKKR